MKAVQGVSLDVRAGEITAVIGPNGAGKTTLFNCITGALRPDRADIRLLPVDSDTPVVLQNLGMEDICRLGVARTFQQVRLFDTLCVLDNVVLGGLFRHKLSWFDILGDRLSGCQGHRTLRAEAQQQLRRVGLERNSHELAGNLDHGNRRRLEIARALAGRPTVLLLDEPAAGMNRVETDELMQLLRSLRDEGIAVLLVEHDMKLVMQTSNFIYVMDHGELLTSGTPQEVAADPRVIEAYLGSAATREVAG